MAGRVSISLPAGAGGPVLAGREAGGVYHDQQRAEAAGGGVLPRVVVRGEVPLVVVRGGASVHLRAQPRRPVAVVV
jgi:hypothetical protein